MEMDRKDCLGLFHPILKMIHNRDMENEKVVNLTDVDEYIISGTELFFEYHCFESVKSEHYHLWLRSHQKVVVVECSNIEDYGDCSLEERQQGGMPLVYKMRFEDGFEDFAFEDELLESEDHYCRTAPPK